MIEEDHQVTYFYASRYCEICDNGITVFEYREDKEVMILACRECHMLWTNPESLDRQNVISPFSSPDWFISEIGCTWECFRPATRAEIVAQGWENHIEGEYEE